MSKQPGKNYNQKKKFDSTVTAYIIIGVSDRRCDFRASNYFFTSKLKQVLPACPSAEIPCTTPIYLPSWSDV
jgi:hypothetical protein